MFAVIFIPNFSLQAALRHEPDLRSRPVALVDPQATKSVITQLTSAARSCGVCEGLTASQAMARCAELIIKPRSPVQEESATEVLLQTAYAFSPNIESTAAGVCTIELKGIARDSLDETEQWAQKIIEVLAQFHLLATVGLANTPELALLAARAENSDSQYVRWIKSLAVGNSKSATEFLPLLEGLEPLGKRRKESGRRRRPARTERAGASESLGRGEGVRKLEKHPTPNLQHRTTNGSHFGNSLDVGRSMFDVRCSQEKTLESLPISSLEPSSEILAILQRWGIHTVGTLLALGKDSVTERLGPEAAELFNRVSPDSPRPLKLVVPNEEFSEQMEFENEIETVEPLLFVLRRFVEQLSRRLELIYLVIAEFHLQLSLSSGTKYERIFKIPAPTGNIDVLFRMLETHLETVRTDSPITSLRLAAKPTKPEARQFGLFESTLRDPNQFAETTARLTALCGSDRVGTPQLEATHKPDTFRVAQTFLSAGLGDFPVARRNAGLESPVNPQSGKSALQLRRFRPPRPSHIEFRDDKPVLLRSEIFIGPIVETRGPFLSSGHWWDSDRWARQEWDVETSDGSLFRIFRSSEGCFVEGVYD